MPNRAALFVGQGSQYPGMGSALAPADRRIEQILSEASEVVGFDIARTMETSDVHLAGMCQPVVLTFCYALFDVMRSRGDAASQYFAGHSLGEYTALACAGALTFADAVRLVHLRGEAMQRAVPAKVAAIVGLDWGTVARVCDEQSGPNGWVGIATINSRHQVVISGELAAMCLTSDRLAALGATVIPLPLSIPVHSPLMEAAAESLRDALAQVEISKPVAPLICGHGAALSEPAALRDHLVEQMKSTVRWDRIMQSLVSAGCMEILEFGPRRTLADFFQSDFGDQVRTRHIASVWDLDPLSTSVLEHGRFESAVDYLDRVLIAAISTPCLAYSAAEYREKVVEPYQSLVTLRNRVERNGEPLSVELRDQAETLLAEILAAKRRDSR
jgi:[acyl-carrier-protein] S-malonyltransferase